MLRELELTRAEYRYGTRLVVGGCVKRKGRGQEEASERDNDNAPRFHVSYSTTGLSSLNSGV